LKLIISAQKSLEGLTFILLLASSDYPYLR
jgi:hypothetical protein